MVFGPPAFLAAAWPKLDPVFDPGPAGPTVSLLARLRLGLHRLGLLCRAFLALGLVRSEHFLLDQRHRAAGLLDGSLGAGRGMIDCELQTRFQLAFAQQPHTIQGAPDNSCGNQRIRIDRLGRIQAAGIDCQLQAAEIDLVPRLAVELVEAALRQAPMQRHLSALEAAEPGSRPRGLAFAAASAGLASAGADAAPDAYAELARTGVVLELIEPHGRSLLDF